MSQPRCRDTCVLKSVRFKNADPCDTPTTDSSPYGLHNLNGSLPEMPCSGFFFTLRHRHNRIRMFAICN